jgi:predicted nucleic acid-binding protein
MEILVDASAVIAYIVGEPRSNIVIETTANADIVSPNILPFEIANALTRMRRRGILVSKEKMIGLIENFYKIPITLLDIDLKYSLEIAFDYKIYAYDAIYLETAKRLHLPLLSFDKGMRKIGQEMGVTLLGEI